jgi:hypothetical protein
MAFISDTPVGKKVRLTQDLKVVGGTYTKGHEFVIVERAAVGFNLRDDSGRELLGVVLEIAPIEFVD